MAGAGARAQSQRVPQTLVRGEGCPTVSQSTSVTICVSVHSGGGQELRGNWSQYCQGVRLMSGFQAPEASNAPQFL